MPTRKKANPEKEAAVKEAAAPVRAKRAAKTAAVETPLPAAEPKKRATRSKSPAATHKTPARKPMAAAEAARRHFDPATYQDEIAREAYFQWLNRGAHHGQAHDDWSRAVEIVRNRYEKAS